MEGVALKERLRQRENLRANLNITQEREDHGADKVGLAVRLLCPQEAHYLLVRFFQGLDQHFTCHEGKVVCEVELLSVLRGMGVEQLAEHGQTAGATLRPPNTRRRSGEGSPTSRERAQCRGHVLQPALGCSFSPPELLRSPDSHEGQPITKNTVAKTKTKREKRISRQFCLHPQEESTMLVCRRLRHRSWRRGW